RLRPPVSGDRDIRQRLQRIYFVLGRLSDDLVAHSVLPVEEEVRIGLETAAQRNQQTGGYILLRQADLVCFGTIHGQIELGLVDGLLNAQIRDAGDLLQFLQEIQGELAVVRAAANDLDVDRRRKTEVEDLAHDIGWQEIEDDSRKALGQVPPQSAYVF